MSDQPELEQIYRRGIDALETTSDHVTVERVRQNDALLQTVKEQAQLAFEKAGIPEELWPYCRWSNYRIFLMIPKCLLIQVHLFSPEAPYSVAHVTYNAQKGRLQYTGNVYNGSEIWVAVGIARREYQQYQEFMKLALDPTPPEPLGSWDAPLSAWNVSDKLYQDRE